MFLSSYNFTYIIRDFFYLSLIQWLIIRDFLYLSLMGLPICSRISIPIHVANLPVLQHVQNAYCIIYKLSTSTSISVICLHRIHNLQHISLRYDFLHPQVTTEFCYIQCSQCFRRHSLHYCMFDCAFRCMQLHIPHDSTQ